MPLTPQQLAAKIRSHKYGQRRLTSNAALFGYNKAMKASNADTTALKQRIAADPVIQACVTALNTALSTALQAGGGAAPASAIIKLNAPAEMVIPRSVWLGYINLNTGGMTAAQRTSFATAESTFADNAGKLRRRVAEIFALDKIENDMANSEDKPNPGGQVGEDN